MATDARLALARLRALTGRFEEAQEWFEKARRVLDEHGARPLRAVVDFNEAWMEVRRGRAGDRERALALLDAARGPSRRSACPGGSVGRMSCGSSSSGSLPATILAEMQNGGVAQRTGARDLSQAPVPSGYRFGGFWGWPGEAGFGLGDHGRSFGGVPWPGGFAGCPCLGLPVLGSDMNISVGPRESAVPVKPAT